MAKSLFPFAALALALSGAASAETLDQTLTRISAHALRNPGGLLFDTGRS